MDTGHQISGLPQARLSEAVTLIRGVFLEFVASGYSNDGINVFLDFISPEKLRKRILASELTLTACFHKGIIIGVIGMEAVGHISLLFVSKKFHRKGIARALIESACKPLAGSDIPAITVNSSPYAVEIYKRLGFETTEEEQCLDGIRFTPMELHLRAEKP